MESFTHVRLCLIYIIFDILKGRETHAANSIYVKIWKSLVKFSKNVPYNMYVYYKSYAF